MSGYTVRGAMGEYCLSMASHSIKIPDAVSYAQAAPILCAGVTTYKALKETQVKPGETITILGAAGGLGHLAVQYAKAMGMRVLAIDVGDTKLQYARKLGAEYAVDARDSDVVKKIIDYSNGGTNGVLSVATQASAFELATKLPRRRGTVVFVGLPPGSFPVPIFDVVLNRITIRGSIVGTRRDMAEAFDFAARGLVTCDVKMEPLDNVNDIFDRLRKGKIEGRVVLQIS